MSQSRSRISQLPHLARVPPALLVLALGAGVPTWDDRQTRIASDQQAARLLQFATFEAGIVERLRDHEQCLESATTHFTVDQDSGPDRWSTYVDRFDLQARAPKLLAFGCGRSRVQTRARSR